MKYLIAVLFLAYSVCADDATPRPKRCPGGYAEGTQVELGRYWYECREGQLVPKGCLNDEGRRVEIYGTFDSSNKSYRLQCIVDPSGYLAFVYKSCLYNNQEHQPGDTWEDDKYYYTCTREGDYLRVKPAGCMDQGKRVGLNERVTKGDFVYQCKQSINGTCSMCPVACNKNGREYAIGDTFELDDYLFTCTNKDKQGPIAIKCIGCLNKEKQRLKDGDRFFKDDVVYECAVRDNEAGVRPVGCVQRSDNGALVERRLGCYWVEGNANTPYQYEMTCKHDKDLKTAVKVQNRCIYKVTQGTYTLDPGCYQIVEKTAIACKKESSSLSLKAYQIDQIGDITAQGLRYC